MANSCNWENAVRTLQWHLYNRDVEPHRADLYAHCCALTANPHVADDLVQESMMRGFGVVGQLSSGMRQPRSYLFRIATNLWIDWCRRSSREARREGMVDEAEAVSMSPQVDLAQADAALRTLLSETEYRAYVMRFVFQFTAREAAEQLGSSMAAVKMAASRARRKVEAAQKLNQ